jgi:hypothetical protein
MGLSREERVALQTRLLKVGLYQGAAEGNWNTATLAALQAVAADSKTFDLSNESGASLLLDHITSDAFIRGREPEEGSGETIWPSGGE